MLNGTFEPYCIYCANITHFGSSMCNICSIYTYSVRSLNADDVNSTYCSIPESVGNTIGGTVCLAILSGYQTRLSTSFHDMRYFARTLNPDQPPARLVCLAYGKQEHGCYWDHQ